MIEHARRLTRRFGAIATMLTLVLVGCRDDRPPPFEPDAGVDAGEPPLPLCDEPPMQGEMGHCVRDGECSGGSCRLDFEAPPEDLATLRLVCGAPGPGGARGDRCASAADCARGLCAIAGTCVTPCASSADCGADERCAMLFVRTGPTANQPVGGCVASSTLAPDIAVEREIRTDALIPFMETPTELGPAPIPTLHVIEPTCGRTAVATMLTTPSRVLFDFNTIETQSGPENGLNPVGRPLTVLLPNGTADLTDVPSFNLDIFADGEADLQITSFRGQREGGLLDLDLFFVEGSTLFPSGGRLPTEITMALGRAETILEGAGIALGEVRVHLIRGAIAERLAIIEVDDNGVSPELGELFRLSAGAVGPSIPIFFVALVEDALGISGGAPGPQGLHGTLGSGIAISASLLRRHIDMLGNVLAHEIGHFLGLFHTTEINGAVLDPFPDTPVCPRTRDLNQDGVLSAEECAEDGGDNLMFWQSTGANLSTQQNEQLGRSLLLISP